jgi:hypothetical protein
MTKLIAFSISKSSIILEYSKDGKELIAIIEPYLFATYLVDLGIISRPGNKFRQDTLMVAYLGGWITFRMFVFDSQMDGIYTPLLLDGILERHDDSEFLKTVFHTNGNTNFSFN